MLAMNEQSVIEILKMATQLTEVTVKNGNNAQDVGEVFKEHVKLVREQYDGFKKSANQNTAARAGD